MTTPTNFPSDDAQATREHVSRQYTRAARAENTTCCSDGCCSTVEQKGVASKFGGYDHDELKSLPDDAVSNSFGCGNPLAFSKVKEGDVVVDLGSGAGIDILIAAQKVGPGGRVIGVDMTDEMIERANANIKAAEATNVEVRKGIIEELPIDDGSVDWVISNCVINLSPEKDRVFAEIARVLKPGGSISISDVVVKDLPDWVRENKALYGGCIGGAISEDDYLAGLKKAGLADAHVTDRIVYDVAQLRMLFSSECCGDVEATTGVSNERLDRLAEEMVGRVHSAKFEGRKQA